jgi:hypothetical protein
LHLGRQSDGLALSEVELCESQTVLGAANLQPSGGAENPLLHRLGRKGMLLLCQHGAWNQNVRVQVRQEIDLLNQNEVVDG